MSTLEQQAIGMSRLLAGRGFAWAGLAMGSTLLQAGAGHVLRPEEPVNV